MVNDGAIVDVAVLIAAWNAEATLERAVLSVLEQQDVSFQIAICDDASTDRTYQIAVDLAERYPEVIALQNPRNAGPARARNRCFDKTESRYVAALDSDDFFEPGRLSALVREADGAGWDLVADDLYRVTETRLTDRSNRLIGDQPKGDQTLDFEDFVAGNISALSGQRGELGFLKPLMRRSFLEAEGLRYPEDVRLGEDYALYALALARGAGFRLMGAAGYVAVMRETSLSGAHDAQDLAALAAADAMIAKEPSLTSGDQRVLRLHLLDTLKRWHWLRLIDAVKERNWSAALGTFYAPPQVGLSLLSKLSEQVVIRTQKRLRGIP